MRLPSSVDHPRHQIDRQRAGAHHRIAVGAAQMPAQRRVAPRQQLGNSERLDDVVVGAEAEQTDFFVLVAVDREDDDRNVRPGANALQDLGAFQIRQVEVENDQIHRAHGRGLEPGGGVLRLDDGKAVKLEAGAQKAPDLRFVVDDQHLSHQERPRAPAYRPRPSVAAATWSCRDSARRFPRAGFRHRRQ